MTLCACWGTALRRAVPRRSLPLAGAAARSLSVSDEKLVGEEDEAVTDGLAC